MKQSVLSALCYYMKIIQDWGKMSNQLEERHKQTKPVACGGKVWGLVIYFNIEGRSFVSWNKVMLINSKGSCWAPSQIYCLFKQQSDRKFVYFPATPWWEDCNIGNVKSHLFMVDMTMIWQSLPLFLHLLSCRMNLRCAERVSALIGRSWVKEIKWSTFELSNPSVFHNKLCHKYVL